MDSVRYIEVTSEASPGQVPRCLARVTEARNGRACKVVVGESGDERQVHGRLASVPYIDIGDHVLVEATRDECVVIGRLARPEEPPAATFHEDSDGYLLIEAQQAIRIQSGQSIIELHADGRLTLDGRCIYTVAEGEISVQGTQIDLN